MLQREPDIGLKMFINENDASDSLTGLGGMSMTVEETLAFFQEVFKGEESGTHRQRSGFKT